MRPDSRSFSFTWLKGTTQSEVDRSRPTTRSMASSISVQNIKDNVLKPVGNIDAMKNPKKINKKDLYGCNPSKLTQLKELGQSFFANSSSKEKIKTTYASIQENVSENEDEMEDQPDGVEPEEPEMDYGTNGTAENSFDKISNTSKSGIGKRFNQKVREVKATFGNLSQKLRRSTRRRYRMTTPLTSAEPTPTRRALGRSPTKLYSPFGFADSPAARTPSGYKTPKRLQRQRPSTPKFNRKILTPVQSSLVQPYSPNGTFQRDIQDMRKGFQEMDILTRKLSKPNLFK